MIIKLLTPMGLAGSESSEVLLCAVKTDRTTILTVFHP